jgi:hypothetical protein
LYAWLSSKLLWNYFIRFVIQQYVTFYISSLINFYSALNFYYAGDATSFGLSILLLAACTFIPLVFGIIVWKKASGSLSQEDFVRSFGTLTEGLKAHSNSLPLLLWNVIGLFNW